MRVEFELFGSEASVGFILIPETDVERSLTYRLLSQDVKGKVSHMILDGQKCIAVSVGKRLKDEQ